MHRHAQKYAQAAVPEMRDADDREHAVPQQQAGFRVLTPTTSIARNIECKAGLCIVMSWTVPSRQRGIAMLSALIGVLIIVVIGAICFWAIDKFASDRRLAQLLKLLVVLICLAAILQRILPLLGVYI
jgi:hypothetical protein